MPTINRQYHANGGNYPSGQNYGRFIAIHNTENTAPALNEAKYAQNNAHGSSFHYVLDGGGTIYQLLDENERSWSVGGWNGTYQYISNAETISIEVCSPGAEFTAAQVEELAWLVPQIMRRHGIPAESVVRHYDCHSGHKSCPRYYSNNGAAWLALRDYITGGDTVTAEELKQIVVDAIYHVPMFDGTEEKPKAAVWGFDGEGTGNGFSQLGNVLFYIYMNGVATRKLLEGGAGGSLPPVDVDALAAAIAAGIGDKIADAVADRLAARLAD